MYKLRHGYGYANLEGFIEYLNQHNLTLVSLLGNETAWSAVYKTKDPTSV
jgi:hypothetical protein